MNASVRHQHSYYELFYPCLFFSSYNLYTELGILAMAAFSREFGKLTMAAF